MKREIRVTFVVSEREREMLDTLIELDGLSASDILRSLVRSSYHKHMTEQRPSLTIPGKKAAKQEAEIA